MSEPSECECHRCGAQADGEMDGKAWCANCLHIAGSCCAGEDDSVCAQDGADS